jgi:hypothetical protein
MEFAQKLKQPSAIFSKCKQKRLICGRRFQKMTAAECQTKQHELIYVHHHHQADSCRGQEPVATLTRPTDWKNSTEFLISKLKVDENS